MGAVPGIVLVLVGVGGGAARALFDVIAVIGVAEADLLEEAVRGVLLAHLEGVGGGATGVGGLGRRVLQLRNWR